MPGVGRGRRSQPFTALPGMWYALGLSYRGIEIIAGLLGYGVAQVTSWRAVRRRLPAGRVRIVAVDETWLRVRGKSRPVGVVVGRDGLRLWAMVSETGSVWRLCNAPWAGGKSA